MRISPDVSKRLITVLVVVLALSAMALLLTGCAAEKPLYNPDADTHLLEFLQDGATTQQDVTLKLGQPSVSLEQGAIMTYRIVEQSDHSYYVVAREPELTWMDVSYSLVLVFDAGQILSQHSMVPVQ